MNIYPYKIHCIIFLSCFFIGCNVAETYSKKGFAISKQLKHKMDKQDAIKIMNKAIGYFDKAIALDKHSWAGYSQKINTFRLIYFIHPDILSKKNFLQKTLAVYELWFANNQEDKKHLIPYAVTLYVDGQEKSALKIFSDHYDEQHIYNMKEPQIDDIYNFVAGILLKKNKEQNYQGTVYRDLLILTDEGLINSFVGG